MRIIRSSPDTLVIEDKPFFLWIGTFGLGGMAVIGALLGEIGSIWERLFVFFLGTGAIWVGWIFAPYQIFVFDRGSGLLTHSVQRFTRAVAYTVPIEDIKGVIDEGYWSEGSRLERITLLTRSGPYPMESGFTGLSRKKTIDEIDAWLKQS